MPLACPDHLVYAEECQRCWNIRIMNLLTKIDGQLQIALAVFAAIEKKRMDGAAKDE